MKIIELIEGQKLTFTYTNHKGEIEVRYVSYVCTEFGSNNWYPEPTIFIRCFDFNRNAERSFDARKMTDIEVSQ